MSDRTYAQRLRDDEDHQLAMCGLTLDARDHHELEDHMYQHHDFKFFAPTPPRARSGADGSGRETAGRAVGPGPYFHEGAATDRQLLASQWLPAVRSRSNDRRRGAS